jgi:hypothetical protein
MSALSSPTRSNNSEVVENPGAVTDEEKALGDSGNGGLSRDTGPDARTKDPNLVSQDSATGACPVNLIDPNRSPGMAPMTLRTPRTGPSAGNGPRLPLSPSSPSFLQSRRQWWHRRCLS